MISTIAPVWSFFPEFNLLHLQTIIGEVIFMGQKKVNKANDSFGLRKSKEQNNKKNGKNFGNKQTNHPNHPAT